MVITLDMPPTPFCQHVEQFWVWVSRMTDANGTPLYTKHDYATTQESNNWIYACWEHGEPSLIANDNLDCGHDIYDYYEPGLEELNRFKNQMPAVYRGIDFEDPL